jgi:hypothetical protein
MEPAVDELELKLYAAMVKSRVSELEEGQREKASRE